jgi:hypothetical protein
LGLALYFSHLLSGFGTHLNRRIMRFKMIVRTMLITIELTIGKKN